MMPIPLDDAKERLYAKFLLDTVIMPFGIFGLFIHYLGAYIEGSPSVVWLAQIGVSLVMYVVWKTVQSIYHFVVRQPKDVLSYGRWAVVTGATSGIGECFCHELAANGMNILLISRNEDKLKNVAQSVESRHNVKTVYLVRDFADTSESALSKFELALDPQLRELDQDGGIGMLCNCVGIVNSVPTLFHKCQDELVRQILCINNDGTVLMTRAVLPFMFARKNGAIITISSGSCKHPTPFVSLYSATKSFGLQLTRSLYYEYKEFGIDCLAVTPYYFISNLYKAKKNSLIAPFPESIVRTSLPLLGYQAETFGWWAHGLGQWLAFTFTTGDPVDGLRDYMKLNRERNLQQQKKGSS